MSSKAVNRAQDPRRGIALVEVMLCVVIVAVCLVPVMQALLGAMRSIREVQGYTRAVLAGENVFFVLAQRTDPDENLTESVLLEDNGYRVKLVPVNNENEQAARSRQAEIRISWQSGVKDKMVILSTALRGGPETKP